MASQVRAPAPGTDRVGPLVLGLDVAAKIVLLALLALLVVDPAWGNLEGKAPTARAITYPLLAFAIPVWWYARGAREPYPWVADLLLTGTAFSDVLGNRLDLYDAIVWFDDWMHVMNTALVSAAVLLLTTERTTAFWPAVERAIAVGMTASLAWEVFEYFSFVTTSSELTWAYADTVGDLALGWLGSVFAAVALHVAWRPHRAPPTTS